MPTPNTEPIETLSETCGAESAQSARSTESPRLAWARRILVAIHGSPSSRPAVVAVRDLSRRSRATVDTLTVYPPDVPLPASSTQHSADQCEAGERREAANLVRAVRRQCRNCADQRLGWPLRIEVGDPGQVIVRLAEETAPDLVVFGIGRCDPADRHQGSRLTTFAARYLRAPLYAVAPECETPTRCVIAFPDGHLHAPTIRIALGCLQPRGRVWIAMPDGRTADASETGSARGLVARAATDLPPWPDDVEFDRIDIVGDMLAGILRLADEVDAQMIAVPMQGPPGAVRAFLPNLADPLLLRARCSVLLVPAEPDSRAMRPAE